MDRLNLFNLSSKDFLSGKECGFVTPDHPFVELAFSLVFTSPQLQPGEIRTNERQPVTAEGIFICTGIQIQIPDGQIVNIRFQWPNGRYTSNIRVPHNLVYAPYNQFSPDPKVWAQQAALATAHVPLCVSIQGNTMAVGYNDGSNIGTVDVFVKDTNNNWTLEQTIQASDATAADGFGTGNTMSISIDPANNNSMAIGANGNGNGEAYIFTRSAGVWTEALKLTNPNAGESFFGLSIALQNGTLAVGGSQNVTDHVNIYTGSGASWTLEATIAAPALPAQTGFGWGVSLDNGTLAIAAQDGSNPNVYIYTGVGSSWSLQQILIPGGGVRSDEYGYQIALSGNILAVGTNEGAGVPGNVYIYTRAGSTWTLVQTLQAPTPQNGDNFGSAVALLGTLLVVGAPAFNVSSIPGAVYTYTFANGTFSPQQTIQPDTGSANNDEFGLGVAVAADEIGVLATNPQAGEEDAYVFGSSSTTLGQLHKPVRIEPVVCLPGSDIGIEMENPAGLAQPAFAFMVEFRGRLRRFLKQ